MTPQEAMQLQPGSIMLFNSQLFRLAEVYRSGQLLLLVGKTMNQIVSPKRPILVYAPDEIPADVQLGHLTTEQESIILGMVAEREAKAREARKGPGGQPA
jgi:hypothetical protein